MSILISVDSSQETPLFKQVVEQITALVQEGTLTPGDRLPSTRLLARQLGVNRTTVYRAYQELWALGYIESNPGSYSVIRQRAEVVEPRNPAGSGYIDWENVSAPGAADLYTGYTPRHPRYLNTLKSVLPLFHRTAVSFPWSPSGNV